MGNFALTDLSMLPPGVVVGGSVLVASAVTAGAIYHFLANNKQQADKASKNYLKNKRKREARKRKAQRDREIAEAQALLGTRKQELVGSPNDFGLDSQSLGITEPFPDFKPPSSSATPPDSEGEIEEVHYKEPTPDSESDHKAADNASADPNNASASQSPDATADETLDQTSNENTDKSPKDTNKTSPAGQHREPQNDDADKVTSRASTLVADDYDKISPGEEWDLQAAKRATGEDTRQWCKVKSKRNKKRRAVKTE